MTEKNRVVLYASEKEGENIPRPQLEHIIQRAAERPRPFDIVTVERVQVFGTNEEARDAIARLAEHGVTVSPVTGGLGPYGWNERPGRLVKWIAESEDEDLNEEERKERELIAKAITAQDTFRVVLVLQLQIDLGRMELLKEVGEVRRWEGSGTKCWK